MEHKNRFLRFIPLVAGVLLLIIAGAVIAFPFISNAYYKQYNEREAEEYDEYIQSAYKEEDTTLQDALKLAQEYNAAIAEGKELPAEYDDVLNISGTGLMGYIEIPKLSLSLPICHGVDYTTLETSVGHLSGTALPVGGSGTHCVLTGHSGMASQRLFSDLDEMEIGDCFYLNILGERFCYQVDDISVILPYELEYLSAVPGEDYCTLVTCTPFGVNTHRLLVRGTRVEASEEAETEAEETQDNPSEDGETESTATVSKSSSTWLRKYITALAVSVLITAAAVAVFVCIRRYRRWHGYDRF